MSEPETGDVPQDELPPEEVPTEDTAEATTEAAEPKPKLSMEVQVDSPSACQRHVTVSVSRGDIERYMAEAFDELRPKAEVPGFRPGRAPRRLVEARFREEISEQVKGSLLMDSMEQISEEQSFSAISEPDFDLEAITMPEDGPLTFEFDVEVRPDFDMPQWKGLKLERPTRQYTDADVERQLQAIRAREGRLIPQEAPAKAEDYVVLNMTFSHEGQQVSRLEEQAVCLKPILSFPDGKLEGFDELMTGAAAGDQKTAKLTISGDAENEDLRGKEVDVAFEVLEVKKLELPPVNHAFLERLGGFESEEDLRTAIRRELESQLAYHQQQRVRQQITSLLTESADWELPPDLLRRQSHRELERAVMELQSSGFSDAQIKAHENEIRQNSQNATATALKEHFILERIAEEQGIDVSDEEFDEEIYRIALYRNEAPRRVRARMEKRGQMDTLRNQIVERKVIASITSEAEFKEVTFEPPVDRTAAVDHTISGAKQPKQIPEAHGGQAEELREPVDHT